MPGHWILLTQHPRHNARPPGLRSTRSLERALKAVRLGQAQGLLIDVDFQEAGRGAWEAAYLARERAPKLIVAVIRHDPARGGH